MSISCVTFVNHLYIGTSVAVNCLPATSPELPIESLFTIHICKNDAVENYLQKKQHFFYIFAHPGDSVSLSGGGLHFLEAPGGITCMRFRVKQV